jgi:ABC-type proline/glycine betaine transport system ATPase subunit
MQYVADNIGNKTVLIVTHDIDEANFLGGKIIEMEHSGSVTYNNYNSSID